jgi:1-phosphofructokinase family hexose kinase
VILCVSPNLCYDRILIVPGFAAGGVHRATRATAVAGGKGLNVARAAAALGESPVTIGFIAGGAGHAIVRGARRGGLVLDAVRVPGESRWCTIIVDPGRVETVINERGMVVERRALSAFRRRVRRRLTRSRAVVLSGSLPPGVPDDFFATLIADAAPRPTILDSSGEGLRRGLDAAPTVAKPNRVELEEADGRRLRTLQDVAAAGRRLRDRGVGWVVATLGEEGAVVVCADGVWHLRAPHVERNNAIGAGDTLAAGLAVGLARSLVPLQAARLGIAAAAADVRTELPGEVTVAMVARLLPDVSVRRL